MDSSNGATSASICRNTWQVGFLHWRHVALCPPCGMRHGRRIHLIYQWLIHLSEPGRVISLSIHPTCSKHKFPFSVRGQLAGLESRRRFLPISVKPIKVKLATLTLPSGQGGRGVWGLAEEWEGLIRCHKLLPSLMHPLRTATNNQSLLEFVTVSCKTLLLDRRFSFGPIAPVGTWCWCHSQAAGQINLLTFQLFCNIRPVVFFLTFSWGPHVLYRNIQKGAKRQLC